MYKNQIKRILDITLSSTALIVLSPVMGVTALLVKKKLGSPVIFKQKRSGKDEKIFTMYKFRTMTDEKDAEGNLLPDDVRLTKFGKTLRSTSLDELPELVNILKWDMSVVGPRPLLVKYLPYYTEKEHHRHDVRSGLTGLAQVEGRSFLTWENIFDHDIEYVTKSSLYIDFSIVIKTIIKVLKSKDIADVSTITKNEVGDTFVLENGKERKLHNPLDIERKANVC
ncbi:sugar transferase [Eubacterium aggregans]|uniref:sugar transferase n=2 Tax=Eubacterium aggregans TaxID=81409 RepID=UPI003F32FC59